MSDGDIAAKCLIPYRIVDDGTTRDVATMLRQHGTRFGIVTICHAFIGAYHAMRDSGLKYTIAATAMMAITTHDITT